MRTLSVQRPGFESPLPPLSSSADIIPGSDSPLVGEKTTLLRWGPLESTQRTGLPGWGETQEWPCSPLGQRIPRSGAWTTLGHTTEV